MSRAQELITKALAPERHFFTMDDLLGEAEMIDFEPDARIRVENANYDFNYGAMDSAHRNGTSMPRVHGLPYAMNVSFDERIPNLSHPVLDQHRSIPTESLIIIDWQKASDGTRLPEWRINDPRQANVMRGLVASAPQQLHILRGSYTHSELARRIWDGEITTGCDVNVSRDCDRNALSGGYRDRKVWGMFSTHSGEYLIFHTICPRCFCAMWPIGDEFGFYTFDPSHQTARDLERIREHHAWRRLQHHRLAKTN